MTSTTSTWCSAEMPQVEVVAFTAAQIPRIDRRRYPPELAGPHYPEGIPIVPEATLDALIEEQAVDEVVFAYSDVSHEFVMHQASRVLAAGADFSLLGLNSTAVPCSVPVISVLATRTGAGKSPTSRFVAGLLMDKGIRPAVIRHPMPYGDLVAQRVQRFAVLHDLDRAEATVEEREDYEPHIRRGLVVWAGVDYEAIVAEAEKEARIIIWDGGNNDFSFLRSDIDDRGRRSLPSGARACLSPGGDEPPLCRYRCGEQGQHCTARRTSTRWSQTSGRSIPMPWSY